MKRVRQQADWPAGRVERIRHRSQVLQGNPWDDPVERDLCVYLPPGYETSGAGYTALWDLAAFTNSGPGHLNWRNHGENLVQRLDRLIHEGLLPPVVVLMPDAYTSLGGNQYVDSAAVGAYASWLNDELVPFASHELNVVDDAAGRGIFGKSSGGYGALVNAMRRPDTWGAVAVHAGDSGFDRVFLPEFPAAALALADVGGDPAALLERFWRKRQPGGRDFTALMVVAMAASYDPDPENPDQIRLPFDPLTCELDPARWAAWLAHDPVNLVDTYLDALNSLRFLYIDVGCRDQYNIQFGTRQLVALLEKRGIRHHFEEFDGTHSQIDWRLDSSLPLLAGALEGRRD